MSRPAYLTPEQRRLNRNAQQTRYRAERRNPAVVATVTPPVMDMAPLELVDRFLATCEEGADYLHAAKSIDYAAKLAALRAEVGVFTPPSIVIPGQASACILDTPDTSPVRRAVAFLRTLDDHLPSLTRSECVNGLRAVKAILDRTTAKKIVGMTWEQFYAGAQEKVTP